MAMAKHIFLMSATARGALAAACVLSFAVPARALDAGETLRVMTFNVRGCKDMSDKVNVQQTANRILAEDPDVCGIQECNAARSAELAAATGLKLFFANDECILSKTEPLSTEVVDLQYYKFYKRILMIAEFDDYIIANTHMSRTSEYGLPEVDVITNALAKYEGKGKPVLFMGDINTRPGFYVDNKLTPLMQCISPRQMAVGEGTYHSEMNSVGEYTWEWILDFIYMDYPSARSGEWSWTSHVVKDHITSDHAPVVADITYLGPYKYFHSGWPPENPSRSAASVPISGFEPGGCKTEVSETAISLEARFRSWKESVCTRLRSDKASGIFIHLR